MQAPVCLILPWRAENGIVSYVSTLVEALFVFGLAAAVLWRPTGGWRKRRPILFTVGVVATLLLIAACAIVMAAILGGAG
jgi:hypothetical protein